MSCTTTRLPERHGPAGQLVRERVQARRVGRRGLSRCHFARICFFFPSFLFCFQFTRIYVWFPFYVLWALSVGEASHLYFVFRLHNTGTWRRGSSFLSEQGGQAAAGRNGLDTHRGQGQIPYPNGNDIERSRPLPRGRRGLCGLPPRGLPSSCPCDKTSCADERGTGTHRSGSLGRLVAGGRCRPQDAARRRCSDAVLAVSRRGRSRGDRKAADRAQNLLTTVPHEAFGMLAWRSTTLAFTFWTR